MNKPLAIGLAVLLVVFAVFGMYWLIKKTYSPVTSGTATTSPFGGLGSSVIPVGNQLTIVLSDGSKVAVPDFTKIDQPAWADPVSGYRVAGSEYSTFLITYVPPAQNGGKARVLVTLLAEPLGATRIAAEDALRTTLKLSNPVLCALDTYVSAGPGLSDTYGTDPVGLSFCPGAVKLP